MENKFKVIVVDDHDMFRKGVKVLLNKNKKAEVIGEASNGKEFLDIIDHLDPDIVLMDISMPVLDGIETTKQALQKRPDLKILTLSMFGDEEYYYKMIQAGVRGFILKSAGIDELEYGIEQVAGGSVYFSKELLDIVKQNIKKSQINELKGYSSRELAYLKSLVLNLSDNDIARDMNESEQAINQLRGELMRKTGSVNTSGLIMFAIKNKIIEP